MTSVRISAQTLTEAQKSLQKLYLSEFGENSLSEEKKQYTRDELISKYAHNLLFWNKHLPDVQPSMTEFTNAQHALCSNGIEQLWNKCDEYNIRQEVDQMIQNVLNDV